MYCINHCVNYIEIIQKIFAFDFEMAPKSNKVDNELMKKYITINVTSTENVNLYKFIHRNVQSLLSPKIILRENF